MFEFFELKIATDVMFVLANVCINFSFFVLFCFCVRSPYRQMDRLTDTYYGLLGQLIICSL